MDKKQKYDKISNHIYKSYVKLNHHDNDNNFYSFFFRTINKIDGVKVKANLLIPTSRFLRTMFFEITDFLQPDQILYSYESSFIKEDDKFTKDNIKNMIYLFHKDIKKIKFDIMTGTFSKYIEPFGTRFADCNNCCVCYENTINKIDRCQIYINFINYNYGTSS
jgi:hypothetical protein